MHKSCPRCSSKHTKKDGFTPAGSQRYKGLSKRQISNISPHSFSTIKRLCQYWLKQTLDLVQNLGQGIGVKV